MSNGLISNGLYGVLKIRGGSSAVTACLTLLDNYDCKATMGSNNTPPASRQISAPRGVTRFWGAKK